MSSMPLVPKQATIAVADLVDNCAKVKPGMNVLIVAANDGRVAMVADHFFPGRLVVIDHGDELYTLYAHLSKIQVEQGQAVPAGEQIGEVGQSGVATGPHLHFEVRINGTPYDPMGYL